MEGLHPTPMSRTRARAMQHAGGAVPADDERWRSVALRWWRTHQGLVPAPIPVPSHGSQLIYYSIEDLRDMLPLDRLAQGSRGSSQWVPAATNWQPHDKQQQGAGGSSTSKSRPADEPGVLMLILLLVVCVMLMRLSEKCMERLRRCRGRGGDGESANISDEDLRMETTGGARGVPSCQQGIPGCRMDEHDGEESEPSLDQPPPYALVVGGCSNADPNTDNVGPKPEHDEPPPPYSECTVVL